MGNEFTEWVKKEANIRQLSHAKIAKLGGVSRSLVTKVLAGEIEPSLDFALAIATAFEVSPNLILHKMGVKLDTVIPDAPELTETIELLRAMPTEKRSLAARLVRMIYRDPDS